MYVVPKNPQCVRFIKGKAGYKVGDVVDIIETKPRNRGNPPQFRVPSGPGCWFSDECWVSLEHVELIDKP